MRDQWYGDHRDLVKWGVLLEIARRYDCKHILQVLYFRPSAWSHLEIDGKRVPIEAEVIQHFRSAISISKLKCHVTIELIADEFHNRREYQQVIIDNISKRTKTRNIVFLDPDTGLEPKGKAGLQHVLESELREIWDALDIDDLLVFYQHKTNRNSDPWIDVKKAQFEHALGLADGDAKLAHALGIANDVAFFFAQKI